VTALTYNVANNEYFTIKAPANINTFFVSTETGDSYYCLLYKQVVSEIQYEAPIYTPCAIAAGVITV
jgi:hypothetical protein